MPVWLTVRVPDDAAPGRYTGRVTLTADGHAPLTAEVALDVVDWRLADPRDFRTWVELIQFPDTLTLEYEVTPWSDEHMELIGRSFAHMAAVGSRVVYVPLIAETNFGNAESMVRWIDNGDGTFAFDFAPMETYLDVAVEHLGPPALVVFQVWDVYVGAKSKAASATGGEARALDYLKERGAELGEGPIVTVVDPATGETANREMPPVTDPEARRAWAALFDHLRERLERRGLADAAALGCLTDAVPTKAETEALAEITGGLPWVGHSHHGFNHRAGVRLHDVAPICYETRVWHTYFSCDPDNRMYGWRTPFPIAYYERTRSLIQFPPTKWRHLPELAITGKQRGVGRIGADYWDVLTDRRGRLAGPVSRRYPQSSWRNLDLYTSLLAPGSDGPVATTRLEALRQGVQECEARIFLESILTDPARRTRLGEGLAERAQRVLDDRLLYGYTSQSNLQLTGPEYLYADQWRSRAGINGHYWFLASGYRERARQLFELAAAAAGRLEETP
ncbi:MAG: glycoside hydrolase domain-containing protein [Planctomycetota bacterium]